MKVLVTGGTGVVGQTAVTELIKRGHVVRLLSRNANEDARQWSRGVESWPANICEQNELRGCAKGCDLVLHLAGVVKESPPEITFENTNVDGTRLLVREAEKSKAGRFIYLSSLGAEEGRSAYHSSKRRAEEIIRGFAGGWTILRPGNVYGPGDEVLSLILRVVRTSPVVPLIGNGDDAFQPIWVEDLAAAIIQSVERTDLHGRVLELAGEELTTINDLLDRLGEITGRAPARVPVPSFVAEAGVSVANALGVELPFNENQLAMLFDGNVIRTPGANALTGVFRIKPTSLDSGLRKLADSQLEQTPAEGVGTLKRKRFWVEIVGSRLTPEQLFSRFRLRFAELAPVQVDLRAEPGTPTILNRGTTLTMALPIRGNVQVRVEQLTPNKATLVTLSGHPLCGAIRALSEQRGDFLRFEIQVYDRPANIADWVVMRALGDDRQAETWESLVRAMVAESGGIGVQPVQHVEEDLEEQQAERIEEWIKDLIAQRKRIEQTRAARKEPTDSVGSEVRL